MALTVPNQWTAGVTDADAEILTNPTPGNWLVAVITSRVTDGSAPSFSFADPCRNLWQLIASPTTLASSAHVAGQLQAEVWACPAARYEGWPNLYVYAAVMAVVSSDVGTVDVDVFEVAGMGNGTLTVDSVTLGTANATAAITLTAPAPTGAVNCLMVAVAAADTTTAVTTSGTGWTALTSLSGTAPNLRQAGAWREATTGGGATFTLTSGTANWAGVVVALRATGVAPAQPNPNWPASQFQIGLGYDLSTPPSRVQWTDQTRRLKELDGDRGIQQELGVATQGQSTLVLDNRDGAYSPRDPGSATANASGTTTTIKIPDAQATNIFKADFFQLKTAAGALKEFTVFQVVSLASAAGTTTITFKRADGGAAALAATASGDLYAGVPIDLYMPYRQLMTWAGKTYVFSTGPIRDLAIKYDGAAYSEAEADATDALETLTAANPSALRGEILRRQPTHYWPMDDAPGTGYAANASGFSNAALTQTVSKYGAGASVSADFGAGTQGAQLAGASADSLLGDSGTGWQSSGQTAAEITQKGYALVGSSIPDFPSITGGVTIVGIVGTDTAALNAVLAASISPTLFILRNTDPAQSIGQGSVIKLSIDRTTGYGAVTRWDKATHAATTSTAAINQLVGNFRAWALAFDRTSWTLYVDGVSTLSGAANLVDTFSGIDIGGEADAFWHGRSFPGIHVHVAVFGRKLTATEISTLDEVTRFGTPTSEGLSRRIRRKLNTVGWKGSRAVNTSTAIAAVEAPPGGSVIDIVNETGGYLDGLVFADAAGTLQYRDRILSAQQTPRATLGENVAGGEIPYQPGMSPSYNPTFIYNNTQVENTRSLVNLTDPQTSVYVAVDDGSSSKYAPRTLQRSTRLTEEYRAWDVGWWYLARYARPRRRVETVTIEASTDPTRWPFVLGVEVGDLVNVTKRHLGAPAYTVRCQVLRVQPHITYGNNGPVTGSVTLTLASAPPVVTVLNDPVLGLAGSTTLGL